MSGDYERVKKIVDDLLAMPPKERARFMRRRGAQIYHPDRQPEELKELGGQILAGINAQCDEMEKDNG